MTPLWQSIKLPAFWLCVFQARIRLLHYISSCMRSSLPADVHRLYSTDEASEGRIARVALHATHLEFVHPRSGETVSIDCDPPADFRSLVQALSPPARGHH